jgi:hypothetical protein
MNNMEVSYTRRLLESMMDSLEKDNVRSIDFPVETVKTYTLVYNATLEVTQYQFNFLVDPESALVLVFLSSVSRGLRKRVRSLTVTLERAREFWKEVSEAECHE